ncbi:protein phosphatase 1 regulatory subunit 14B-like [Lineus longissimus]|uniref:protein phosphatase 1 regulatory subunit 14B-like n=1 Tax=Lineus longissimus TaxID=88925 RepID=UPI00315CE364
MAYSNTTADRRRNPPGMEKNNFTYASPEPSRVSEGPNTNTSVEPVDKNVNFGQAQKEKDDDRRRFFTGKYDKHALSLISKRIRVEDWVSEQMLELYECSDNGEYEAEIDLEELLNEDEDTVRRTILHEKLSDAKKDRQEVDKFVENLLVQLKNL